MKYVTIIDIAKELGISKSTVSRALSGDTHNVCLLYTSPSPRDRG